MGVKIKKIEKLKKNKMSSLLFKVFKTKERQNKSVSVQHVETVPPADKIWTTLMM